MSYEFVDINEVSGDNILPSEALMINGDYIENLISGYRTLNVSGREALSPELAFFETGVRDGSKLQSKRYPARTIKVKYQIAAESNEAFREAYNQLASILNVENAELIFNDEQDKFFIGTPSYIGEVEPGRNAVVGEFEIFCADPFKYSVAEYVAEADLSENSILVDYNGTYKAFPTLEAEFFNENESEAALTGKGDCGYVAFFNESEKIIQLGDPEEKDIETYPKSQTLVSQKFNTETAWGSVAETNWPTNLSKVPSNIYNQTGNVGIAASAYAVTTAPATSGTLLTATSKDARPYVDYKVSAKASGRTANSVDVKVTIISSLAAKSNSGATTPKAGAKITLNKTNLYASSTTGTSSGTRTGTYYLWDAAPKNGRIRITNKASNAGKSGQVTGWVKLADVSLSGDSAVSLGKGRGLKGSIQINGGDWYKVTLKSTEVSWYDNSSHTATVNVKVKGIEADTDLLENIKFKVERDDNKDEDDKVNDEKVGVLDETVCKDLEISVYIAPVPNGWYLMPQTYGTGSMWHGPSITRTIPADASGEVGAKRCTLSYSQKMAIGNGNAATQELGSFHALLVSGSGTTRKVVAGVYIRKHSAGKTASLQFVVNDLIVDARVIDLSYNNKYFGNNSSAKGIKTVKTSTITKAGAQVQFNVGGIRKTFTDAAIANVAVTEITFSMTQYGTKPVLSFNGLYWAKFVKENSTTRKDIPNKFSANDVVSADCGSGEVYLNDTLTPSLGALGNDWEGFYLTPGLNQIGFSYSDWVDADCAPKPKVRYREVFL